MSKAFKILQNMKAHKHRLENITMNQRPSVNDRDAQKTNIESRKLELDDLCAKTDRERMDNLDVKQTAIEAHNNLKIPHSAPIAFDPPLEHSTESGFIPVPVAKSLDVSVPKPIESVSMKLNDPSCIDFNGIVIIIYSCSKNDKKSQLLYKLLINSIIDCNVKIYILNGNIDLVEDYKIIDEKIYLKCKDNYDGLYLKTKKLFKEIVNIFPNLNGVIKMDDDIYPNIYFITSMIKFLKNSNINFCGKVVVQIVCGKNAISYDHVSKCEEEQNKGGIELPACTYCSGPCYYVSKKGIKYFNKNCKDFFLEDIMVGLTFKDSIIKPLFYPTYYDDKSYIYQTNLQNFRDERQHDFLTFIKLHGGLGNQLFQIATGLNYCKKNNSLPILVYNQEWCTHFNINKSLNILFKNINKLSFNDFEKLDIRYGLIKPENNCLDAYKYFSLPGMNRIKNNVLLDGYFQNIQYFNDNFEEINNLIMNNDYINLIKKKYMNIENEYFIHIRRGDYVGNKLYEIDYDTYFSSALTILIQCNNKNNNKLRLNVLSNDIEYCKSYNVLNKFSSEIDIIFIECVDEIESFYLMTQCVGGILSNSSYSWWASYINNSDNKKFIIPKKWIDNKNIDMTFDKNVLTL